MPVMSGRDPSRPRHRKAMKMMKNAFPTALYRNPKFRRSMWSSHSMGCACAASKVNSRIEKNIMYVATKTCPEFVTPVIDSSPMIPVANISTHNSRVVAFSR